MSTASTDTPLPPGSGGAPSGVPLRWEHGTAYDLFASLFVLHNAESTGLRRAWAAGVRNRLSPEHREIIQRAVPFVAVPVEWISGLRRPRDGRAVMTGLATLSDDEVLPALADRRLSRAAVVADALGRGAFTRSDVDGLLGDASLGSAAPGSREEAEAALALFASAERSGRLLKGAIVEYHARFFREEEERIGRYLEQSLAAAWKRAEHTDVVELVEELSGGLRLEDLAEAPGVMLIPSFWAGPLVLFQTLPDDTRVILYSARPRDMSLVPGDPVPDALTRALQAVSDQTRLRILKILASASRSQVEIARELRLRPPTITHHLRVLRMANMVRLTESTGGEKRYDVRERRLRELLGDLTRFLGIE